MRTNAHVQRDDDHTGCVAGGGGGGGREKVATLACRFGGGFSGAGRSWCWEATWTPATYDFTSYTASFDRWVTRSVRALGTTECVRRKCAGWGKIRHSDQQTDVMSDLHCSNPTNRASVIRTPMIGSLDRGVISFQKAASIFLAAFWADSGRTSSRWQAIYLAKWIKSA